MTVVTCAPNHPHGKLYPGYRNRLWQSETLDGVKVVRLWTWLAANEGFLPRILNYVSYMVAAILALPFLPKADVVVTTSPQFFCGLVGLFARSGQARALGAGDPRPLAGEHRRRRRDEEGPRRSASWNGWKASPTVRPTPSSR